MVGDASRRRRLPALPPWIAHRGGGALAPENTLAGIRLAAARGFAAVEFDVMLSADGTPVLIHDETLQRTTNGGGLVAETPDRILFGLDAGNGEHIPHLAEALALCRQLGLLANVEIKPAAGMEALTALRVLDLLRDDWPGHSLLLSSFSRAAMEIVAERAPLLPRGLLFPMLPDDWARQARDLAADSIHVPAEGLTADLVEKIHAAGLAVLVYTVNETQLACDLFALGVDALFTDRLAGFAAETSACNSLHPAG